MAGYMDVVLLTCTNDHKWEALGMADAGTSQIIRCIFIFPYPLLSLQLKLTAWGHFSLSIFAGLTK